MVPTSVTVPWVRMKVVLDYITRQLSTGWVAACEYCECGVDEMRKEGGAAGVVRYIAERKARFSQASGEVFQASGGVFRARRTLIGPARGERMTKMVEVSWIFPRAQI